MDSTCHCEPCPLPSLPSLPSSSSPACPPCPEITCPACPRLSRVQQAGAYAGLGLAVVFGLVAINLIYKWADRKLGGEGRGFDRIVEIFFRLLRILRHGEKPPGPDEEAPDPDPSQPGTSDNRSFLFSSTKPTRKGSIFETPGRKLGGKPSLRRSYQKSTDEVGPVGVTQNPGASET